MALKAMFFLTRYRKVSQRRDTKRRKYLWPENINKLCSRILYESQKKDLLFVYLSRVGSMMKQGR